jgi:uncharacterized protein (TIGR02266 family)
MTRPSHTRDLEHRGGNDPSEETAVLHAPAVSERRKHDRRSLEAEIGVYSETNFYTGFSQDISEGGIFVATYDLEPIGSRIDLEFVLPDGHVVRVHGEVRWVKDPIESDSFPGMGIRFIDLSPADLEAIQEFVSNREPLFHA